MIKHHLVSVCKVVQIKWTFPGVTNSFSKANQGCLSRYLTFMINNYLSFKIRTGYILVTQVMSIR
jgi:hypothetical protein